MSAWCCSCTYYAVRYQMTMQMAVPDGGCGCWVVHGHAMGDMHDWGENMPSRWEHVYVEATKEKGGFAMFDAAPGARGQARAGQAG